MELYPHNQKAFDSAMGILQNADRTCIIHPTGTGKSLIIAKTMTSNPGKKHLLLAPSTVIEAEVKKHTGLNFDFSTYHGLLTSANAVEIARNNYDYIYLDEFHRIGATHWGQKTMDLIAHNKGAKILGTSATPVRYLDDQRDMSFELFDGSVASQLSLAKAIGEGVLRSPKYVSALYSISEEAKEAIKKIKESNHADKDGLISKIKSSVIDWERSGGIDAIFKKHLLPGRKKIIVFCKSRTHMIQAKNLLMPSFRMIWKDVEAYEVYSKLGNKHNAETLAQFSEPSTQTKILFTIDKLNEGLHVKGVNTVILMRDTYSPTIYYQQIGRCFSVGQDQNPLIFDFVNNFNILQGSEFKQEIERLGDGSKPASCEFTEDEKFEVGFFDETKQWNDIFTDVLSECDNWEVMFAELVKFKEENGHCDVVQSSGKLGNWVNKQRYFKKKGYLPAERIERLDSIGFNWVLVEGVNFDERYNALVEYIELNRSLKGLSTTPKDLSRWLNDTIRRGETSNLTREQIQKLNDLYVFANRIFFEERYNTLVEYLEVNGSWAELREYDRSGYDWVRTAVRSGKTSLTPEQIQKLKDLQIFTRKPVDFDERYNALVEYRESNGSWVGLLKFNKRYYDWVNLIVRKGRTFNLTPEQVQKLKDLQIFNED